MSRKIHVTLVFCLALAAYAFLVHRGGTPAKRTERVEPADPAAALRGNAADTATSPATGSAPPERAAGEVRAMPLTLRNSTFLIAIRRAGYYCDDVVSAAESAEGGWVATCADKGGYTLSVRAIDRFDVRPIGHYFDGITPIPVQLQFEPR